MKMRSLVIATVLVVATTLAALQAQAGPTGDLSRLAEYGPTIGSPWAITSGPDGNLWFTDVGGSRIGKVTTAGVITEYGGPTPGGLWSITTGPDGNLWYTDAGPSPNPAYPGLIGVFRPGSHYVTEYGPTAGWPSGITTGPDGNLWFTDQSPSPGVPNQIGKITPAGVITEYGPTAGYPRGITTGPDGNLWFTEFGYNGTGVAAIGQITPAGVITEYGPTAGQPEGITIGPDGNLWFADFGAYKIGKITTAGVITEYSLTTRAPWGITAGSDGNLWFTEYNGTDGAAIGQITPAGVITEYGPTEGTVVTEITTGPDGNPWFVDSTANKIGRLRISGPTFLPDNLADVGTAAEVMLAGDAWGSPLPPVDFALDGLAKMNTVAWAVGETEGTVISLGRISADGLTAGATANGLWALGPPDGVGGPGTGIARGVAFRSFFNFGSQAQTFKVNAVLDGILDLSGDGGGALGSGRSAIAAIYVFNSQVFKNTVNASGLGIGEFLFSGDSLSPSFTYPGTRGSLAGLFPAQALLGSDTVDALAPPACIEQDPPFGPFNCTSFLVTDFITVGPGETITLLFDVWTSAYNGPWVSFGNTLKPAPVFFTDVNGQPVTTIQPTEPCPTAPQPNCALTTVPLSNQLTITEPAASATTHKGDSLTWKWLKGVSTTATDFGDPLTTDSYALCMYDGSGTLSFAAAAPAGGTCQAGRRNPPCWKGLGKPAGSQGFGYTNPGRMPAGLGSILLKPGGLNRKGVGTAHITVTGKGPNLLTRASGVPGLPVLPLTLPQRVQLQASNGQCWEATYDTAGVKTNNATKFNAKGN